MRLIYCLQPRCGSSVISRSLEKSTSLDFCPEPFNPDVMNGKFAMYYQIHRHKIGDDTYGVHESFKDAFDLILTNWDFNNTFMKHIDFQLREDDNKKLINRCDSIVYLYRKNLFKAEMSRYLSYTLRQETGLKFWNWSSTVLMNDKSHADSYQQKAFDEFMRFKRPPLKLSRLQKTITDIKRTHKKNLETLKDKSHIVETYEDFFEGPEERFLRIVKYFNTKVNNDLWKKLTRPQNKICNEDTYKLIENYDEIKNIEQECILP